MSRLVPWRNKPTQLISDMIEAAKDYRLYLVSETGPFSFVFKDDSDNKFKVTLGSTLKCSCGVVSKDHCLHTIFALLKRFKVDENNPIIWQASYLDSQLQGILQMKYCKKVKVAPVFRQNNFKKESQVDSDFSEVGQDQTCPICYLQMTEECYSTCGQCKKHLHTNCFKIWMKHKQDTGDRVTCPLCRNQFNNPNTIIARDLDRWGKKFTIHKGTRCLGCGLKNISGQIYHCVVCEQCNLCKHCYNHHQHPIHDKFLYKTTNKQNWRIAPSRGPKLFKSTKCEPQQSREPSKLQLAEFLTGSIPSIKECNGIEMGSGLGLNIIGNQLKLKNLCKVCEEPGGDDMKRLTCCHTLHKECIHSLLLRQEFFCPCEEPLLPGYASAMSLKPHKVNPTQRQKEKPSLNQKPKQKLLVEKPRIKHFRVRKGTVQKKSLTSDPFFQINNMPIRTRSVLRTPF